MFDQFEQAVEKYNLQWNKLVQIGSDGCPAMMGKTNGFCAKVKSKAPGVVITHCLIHLQALAGKSIDLDNTMKEVVNVIGEIKSDKLPHPQFQALHVELECHYPDMIYFTAVRWLSKGKVLGRFLNIIEEIRAFLIQRGIADKYDQVFDTFWIAKVAFLADIVADFNECNLIMQEKDNTVLEMVKAIKKFIRTINGGIEQVSKSPPNLEGMNFLQQSSITDVVSNQESFLSCLKSVKENLAQRFDTEDFIFLSKVTQCLEAPTRAKSVSDFILEMIG